MLVAGPAAVRRPSRRLDSASAAGPARTGPVAGAPWSATSYPMTPYGPMYRKDDPAFAAVVDRTFARLGETRRILRT